MQYDALSFGWQTSNGTATLSGELRLNTYTTVYSFSIKPPASSISAIRCVGRNTGTITNSANKCYIVEGITGKLYLIATVSAANDTFTLANYHNVAVNDKVVLFGGTMPTGITRGGVYWVVYQSGNDIKVSATQGGTPIDLTDTGTNVCVAKYVDHSELTTVTNIESTNNWYDFTGFNSVSLDNDKIYSVMFLSLESTPGSNYIYYRSIGNTSNGWQNWNLRQYTIDLTSINRTYVATLFQHRITYANGEVDDFLFGYSSGNSSISVSSSDAKRGNYYKNNTDTKLFIRNVVLNGSFTYNNANSKDLSFICVIRDRATKNVLATSIPLKPYNFATSGTSNQYFYFEFSSAYEWAKDAEIYVTIEYNSGTVDSSNYLSINYIPWDETYYNGVKALFKRRGRASSLLFQAGVSCPTGSSWIEYSGSIQRMEFLELQFDTYNPTGSVSSGGGSTEYSSVF